MIDYRKEEEDSLISGLSLKSGDYAHFIFLKGKGTCVLNEFHSPPPHSLNKKGREGRFPRKRCNHFQSREGGLLLPLCYNERRRRQKRPITALSFPLSPYTGVHLTAAAASTNHPFAMGSSPTSISGMGKFPLMLQRWLVLSSSWGKENSSSQAISWKSPRTDSVFPFSS